MNESEIVWADPPPTNRPNRYGSTIAFLAVLKKRPGEWAKYPVIQRSRGAASTYRRLHPQAEWTSRNRPDGRTDLYARWIGGVDE